MIICCRSTKGGTEKFLVGLIQLNQCFILVVESLYRTTYRFYKNR